MSSKGQILERLGEHAVLLPELIGAGLAANDRAKLRLTMLQEALAHARRGRSFRYPLMQISGLRRATRRASPASSAAATTALTSL